MNSVNITAARQNLYKLVSDVNESHKPIRITGKNGDGVLISADDWSAIEETLYLNSISGMVESIQAAHAEPDSECLPLDEVEW